MISHSSSQTNPSIADNNAVSTNNQGHALDKQKELLLSSDTVAMLTNSWQLHGLHPALAIISSVGMLIGRYFYERVFALTAQVIVSNDQGAPLQVTIDLPLVLSDEQPYRDYCRGIVGFLQESNLDHLGAIFEQSLNPWSMQIMYGKALKVAIAYDSDPVNGSLFYNPTIVADAAIEHFPQIFNLTLKHALTAPNLPLSEITALTDAATPEAMRLPVKADGDVAQPVYPLALTQQRLWVVSQLDLSSSACTIAATYHLSGACDIEALQQALTAVVTHHSALRTSFDLIDNQPYQHIQPAITIPLPVFSVADADAAIALLQSQAQQPFDLQHGPLVKAALAQIQPNQHYLGLFINHLITDNWAMATILRDLATAYTAIIQGTPIVLPPVSPTMADVVRWQHHDHTTHIDRQRAYWTEVLTGVPALLTMPIDRPRPAIQTFAGDQYRFVLPQTLTEELNALSQREEATLFTSLLAGWSAVLSRYAGQETVVVGVPMANRSHKELQGVVGCLSNTIALRVDLDTTTNYRTLIHHVRERVLGAEAHQSYPFERVVDDLSVERHLSYNPLYQVMFSFQERDLLHLSLTGMDVEGVPLKTNTAMSDIKLEIIQHESELRAQIEYNTALFDGATIERLAGHFMHFLDSAVHAPDQAITTVPMIANAAELHRIVSEWNATAVEYPQPQTLPALLEAQFLRTPAAPALTFADQHLTYAQLHQRANQLAHYLQAHGVGPNTLVGIAMERSIELVVGLIGILKAGGAYVPIDPAYPEDRLRYMVEDAQVSILLTQAQFEALLPTTTATVIAVDTVWPTIAESPATPPPSTIQPDDLVYMIYTSGSTGLPKGTLNTHRGICNRLLWMQQEYGLDATEHVLQKTPVSFDVSVWEFFCALVTGGRLVLALPEGHKDPAYLRTIIQQEAITTVHFVPAMLQIFLEEPGIEACTSIRRVICSGEALSVDLQHRWFARHNAGLHNLYGPTETAVEVTHWACQPNDHSRTSVPIGRPIANTQMYILDPLMQPVPIGVAGELHIGGVQVGAGYWNRPELTADRFVRDPWSAGRLYKTGDLARYRADGTIEYLGRMDQQVKLRGLRIELGEIEAALTTLPEVTAAVVLVRGDIGADQHLVAYVTTSTREGITTDGMRQALRRMLPEYMIPLWYVIMEQFPVTPNGKLDRKALPLPSLEERTDDQQYVAPQSETEQLLAAIWGDCLRLTTVGVHDHFFMIGGNSLLAAQIIAQLRSKAHIDLPFRTIFEHPTIADLARAIDTMEAKSLLSEATKAVQDITQIDSESANALLATFSDLSESDIDALLNTMLEEDEIHE